MSQLEEKEHSNINMSPKVSFILGIDIGTTSVKVCLFDSLTKEVVLKNVKDTLASIPSTSQEIQEDLQDVTAIYSALQTCIQIIPKDQLQSVIHVAVCGQMHGVIYWRQGMAWRINAREHVEVANSHVSSLYTWQDQRCSPQFLSTLPTPLSHLSINTGYGCATTFWLQKNNPQFLSKFDRCGTVMDFVVAMILDLDAPIMSDHNAASFGYFDPVTGSWNTYTLAKADFPVHLLPQVMKAGSTAGCLRSEWLDIPVGTPVSCAMGDLQCSVKATIVNTATEAVLNVSTSAQIAFVHSGEFQEKSPGMIQSWPYFQEEHLAVSASLTGGNTLAAFVKMIHGWVNQLGLSISQDEIWEKIMAAGVEETEDPSIEIVPTVYGERHAPDMTGMVCNIKTGNIGLGQVTRSLCRGIIQNLSSMMTPALLRGEGIERILGCGACLLRNPVLKQELQHIYELPLKFVEEGNACAGAAMAVKDKYC